MTVRPLLSMADAATRVKRSRATIERWIAEGMPVVSVRNDRGTVVRRFVDERDLLTALRSHLDADPTRPRISHDETGVI